MEEEEEEERRTVFSSSTPRGARDADGGYGGKMCVPGYSGSSWESSFDSQCLEIIRGRGGPGVATATANQRAKKNFSFYIAHFSLLAPRKGARGRVRGVARSLARSLRITAEGVAKPSSPTEDNVCKDTLKRADISPCVRVPNRARIRARIGERGRNVDAKHPGISIAPYTPRALVFFALRSEIRADATVSMQQQSRPNTVPANFLPRRTRPPAFLPSLPRLFPSCRPPLIVHCRIPARERTVGRRKFDGEDRREERRSERLGGIRFPRYSSGFQVKRARGRLLRKCI